MQNDTYNYIIAGGQEGKDRLNVLSGVMSPYTKELLLKCGLKEGSHFLDNGCGGGNVAIMVAEIVGNKGKVVGTDKDADIIKLAEKDAAQKGLKNIQFTNTSAYELNYQKEFDIVYARFLLSHLIDPEIALQKMKEAANRGGKIIIEDIQFSGHFCYPANAAFDKYVQLYTAAVKQKGADANIGPGLPELLKQAGIQNISFDVIQPTFQAGEGKWMAYITLDKIKASVIEEGLATEGEITELLLALENFTKDTNSIISLPRIFRVFGTVV